MSAQLSDNELHGLHGLQGSEGLQGSQVSHGSQVSQDSQPQPGNNSQKIVFSDEQAKVIKSSAKNHILVVAGAGSGKTFTMTQRVIELINQGVAPESILGLTFTNKAAAELLSRVSAAVSKSSSNIFLKPEVMTYDAFFQSIVRKYGVLIGFSQNAMPLSDAGAYELVKSVVGDYIDEHSGTWNLYSDDCVISLYGFKTLCKDVLSLYSDIACSMIGVDAENNVCDSVPQAVSKIRRWNKDFLEFMDGIVANKTLVEHKDYAPAIPKYSKAKTKSVDEKNKIFKRSCENFEQYWDNACVEESMNLVTAAKKRNILLDLVLAFDKAKRKANMAQFSDFTIAAYRLVTKFPSIAIQYREQYKQVLLDEYQDTSTTQAMLINKLFNYDDPEIKRASNARKTNTYITAVGDPFQAIYGFRGASSGAFVSFKNSFNSVKDVDLSECSLTTTRRNARLILNLANDLTKPMRESAFKNRSSVEDCEVDVEVLKAMDNATSGTVAAVVMPTKYQEIEAVVRFAKLFSNPDLTPLPGDENRNPLKPRVAILFRSKLSMPLYADALREAGLKVSVVGCSSVKNDPAVKDVLALLNIVNDHSRSSDLMRLLATARFALSAEDLKTIASIADEANAKYQYDIYVQAGMLPSGLSGLEMMRAVTSQRNGVNSGSASQTSSSTSAVNVDNGVFLADILMSDLDENTRELKNRLSKHGYEAVRRVSEILKTVSCRCNDSLNDVMRAAVEALNVDIDSGVAACVNDNSLNRQKILKAMHGALDSLNSVVSTYIQEMSEWQSPSLKGLMSWIDATEDFDSADSSEEEDAQVVMMTVHQSKGLQWPAVAVVGLNATRFPSSQGDSLRFSVDSDDDSDYIDKLSGKSDSSDSGDSSDSSDSSSSDDCVKNKSEISITANVPIEYAACVPVPLRVDSHNLPHFPHDASLQESMHPKEALKSYDCVEKIYDEMKRDRYNSLRDFAESVYESDAIPSEVDPDQFLSEQTKEIYSNSLNLKNNNAFTQSEERGNQLHMEERHLLYVAMTRAQFVTMLSCARTAKMATDDVKRDMKMSIFMKEALKSLCEMNADCVYMKAVGESSAGDSLSKDSSVENKSDEESSSEEVSSEESNKSVTFGVALGEYAHELAQALEEKTNQPSSLGNVVLPWPITLSEDLENTLKESVRFMKNGDICAQSEDTNEDANADANSSDSLNSKNDDGDVDDSLTSRARIFVNDSDLMPKAYKSSEDIMKDAAQKARNYASYANSGTTSITTMQRSAKLHDTYKDTVEDSKVSKINNRSMRKALMAWIRPIPSVATLSSDLGTQFHAWAEDFVNAGNLIESNVLSNDFSIDDVFELNDSRIDRQLAALSGISSKLEVSSLAQRDNLTSAQQNLANSLGDASRNDGASINDGVSNDNSVSGDNSVSIASKSTEDLLLLWKRRLVQSRWSKRVSLAAELPISFAIGANNANENNANGSNDSSSEDKRVLNGVLDAVFIGGLDSKDSSKRFTIVDWKTGKKPVEPLEIQRKLVQLDWYRLMLSAVTGVNLDSIDATLYYVSEENEESREIHASMKNEQQIRSELGLE